LICNPPGCPNQFLALPNLGPNFDVRFASNQHFSSTVDAEDSPTAQMRIVWFHHEYAVVYLQLRYRAFLPYLIRFRHSVVFVALFSIPSTLLVCEACTKHNNKASGQHNYMTVPIGCLGCFRAA